MFHVEHARHRLRRRSGLFSFRGFRACPPPLAIGMTTRSNPDEGITSQRMFSLRRRQSDGSELTLLSRNEKPCDDAHAAMQATCVHRGVANSREKHCGLAVIELTAAHGTDDHTAERTSPHGPFLVLTINPGHRTLALERPTAWQFHVKHRVHDAHLLDQTTWDGLHWDHTDGMASHIQGMVSTCASVHCSASRAALAPLTFPFR